MSPTSRGAVVVDEDAGAGASKSAIGARAYRSKSSFVGAQLLQ
ncbi:hypothetical protein C8D03_2271 [Bosea sp. 124]|nr:hypothetical protein C8D03_2271 [Bosea sp. 124]